MYSPEKLQPPVCVYLSLSWSIKYFCDDSLKNFMCIPVPMSGKTTAGFNYSLLCSTVLRREKAAVDQPLDLLML